MAVTAQSRYRIDWEEIGHNGQARLRVVVTDTETGVASESVDVTRETLADAARQLVAMVEGADAEGVERRLRDELDALANVVPEVEPLRLAEYFLKTMRDAAGRLRLRRHLESWHVHRDGGYYPKPDEELAAELYRHLDDLWTPKSDGKGLRRVVATGSRVNEVLRACIAAGAFVAGEAPLWLDGRAEPAPHDVVAFKNGLLDAAAYCRGGDPTLLPPTPEWFGGAPCPFDFDPHARCPLWLDCLGQWFNGDPESVALLQEWLGYTLTPDNSHEKIMLFQGPPRSGKGTTLSVMQALLGPDQFSVTSFTKLAGRFGLDPLRNKLAAFLPDAHVGRYTDDRAALETLKTISGGDPQGVDRKGLKELGSVRLVCRFVIAVNELPKLPDSAGALKPRLLLLHYANSYEGHEDEHLKARLAAEVPGVAVWALEGLRRLRQNRAFTVPKASAAVVQEFERLVSPVKCFLHERCEVGPGHWIAKTALYGAWSDWCRQRGDDPGNVAHFGQQLVNAAVGIQTGRRGPRGQQFTTYEQVRPCD